MHALKFMHRESSSWSHSDSSRYIKATQEHRLCRIKAHICICKSTSLWKPDCKFNYYFFVSSLQGLETYQCSRRCCTQADVSVKCRGKVWLCSRLMECLVWRAFSCLEASMWVRKQYWNITVFLNPLLIKPKLFTREACNPLLKIMTNSSNITIIDTGATDFLLYFSK